MTFFPTWPAELQVILQCPECNARYLVPDSSFKSGGRNVRCAKCGNTWFAKAPPSNPVLGELDKLLDEINARPATGLAKGANLPALRGRATLRQKAATLAAAAITLAVIFANFSPGLVGQPASKGLMLTDVGFAKLSEGDEKTYQITGKISNITGRIIPAPTLRITLVDEEGASLQYWEYSQKGEIIGPWNKLAFDTGPLDVRFQRGSP
ncbi:MAG: hypothetical protein EBV03_05545 [Proteobacteria bacterium]|nr:hypothetical protein [Pseudomonadota bacterium]